jgi:hypothetical protein
LSARDGLVLACLFLPEFGSGLGVMMLDIAAGAIRPRSYPIACGRGRRQVVTPS